MCWEATKLRTWGHDRRGAGRVPAEAGFGSLQGKGDITSVDLKAAAIDPVWRAMTGPHDGPWRVPVDGKQRRFPAGEIFQKDIVLV